MASGRFISSTLGDSERFSALTDARYQVAFVLIVTWADAEGRFNADPVTLNGKLFTRLGWTPEVVTAALAELHDVGLIRLYQVGSKPFGVVERFHDHNTITRKADGTPAREAASKLPAPPQESSTDRAATAAHLQPAAHTTPEQLRNDCTVTAQESSTDRAATAPEVEVEVEVEVEGEVEEKNPPTPLTAEPPSPELVEAPPRRGERPPALEAKKGKASDPNAVRAIDQPFVDAWNENRGPLPSVLSLDQGRRRHLDKLRAELGDEALDVFTDATKQLAREPFYRQKGYGLTQLLAAGNLLTWAEKWRSTGGMSDQDRRLADKARAVADAIGGL